MGKIPRRSILVLCVALAAVYLANLDVLRVVRDDWCNLPRLGEMVGRGWEGAAEVVSNRWVKQGRVFFLSWLLQGAFARVFGLAPLPYFLFTFGVHLLCALLILALARRWLQDEDLALSVALCALLAPTSTSVLFFLNNWFFLLPTALFLLLAHLYLAPLRRPGWDLAALTATALLAQFSGEQPLALVYGAFLLAAAKARRAARDRARLWLRSLVPAAVCGASLAAYAWRYVLCYPAAAPMASVGVESSALKFAAYHLDFLRPWSWIYGGWSVPASPRTWLAILALGLAWWRATAGVRIRACAGRARFAGLSALAILGCWLPILLGLLLGQRSDVEARYLYPSGMASGCLIALGLDGLAWRLRSRLPGLRRALHFGVPLYFAFLVHYDLRDVWGAQARIDARIWSMIDRSYAGAVDFLATDSLQRSALMPYARSNAISDFQADWGVRCRLDALRGDAPVVTRRYGMGPISPDGSVELEGYAGDRYRARPGQVLAVVFRYGPSFRDLESGFLAVFADFGEYLRFRRAEPIRFPGERPRP